MSTGFPRPTTPIAPTGNASIDDPETIQYIRHLAQRLVEAAPQLEAQPHLIGELIRSHLREEDKENIPPPVNQAQVE